MNVVLYARCSTADQSVDLQLDALREYAAVRRFTIVEEYLDEGVSGARPQRPALDRLLKDGERRRFDAVVAWKLDRVGRSLHNLLEIIGRLEAVGVDLILLDDGIDTTTPAGRLFFQMRGAFAEYERNILRERTRAGLAAARRRGRRLGRPPVFVPLEHAQTLVHAGHSVSAVARKLRVSVSSFRRALAKARTALSAWSISRIHWSIAPGVVRTLRETVRVTGKRWRVCQRRTVRSESPMYLEMPFQPNSACDREYTE